MFRNRSNGSSKFAVSPESLESVTAYTPWRKSLVVTLGTTGCQFAESLIQVHPEMADTIVGIDTAAPTSGEEQGTAPSWLIELPPHDLRSLVRSPLPFFHHPKWRELEYPLRVDHGAGATRAIGAALAAPEFARIRQRIRQCFVQVLQDPPPSGIVSVLLAAGGGGGSGSALLSLMAYWVHHEARMIAPGISVRVEIMLILDPYYHAVGFQGTEREARRLPANVAQTLREILWLQTPANGIALQHAMGILNPIDVPPVSSLLPFGSDATGAALTPERLFSRMVAVGIARNHPGVAEVDRNLLSNTNVQMNEREIITADATAVAWLPPAIGEYYALSKEEEELTAALVLPEAERVEGLKDSFKPRLGHDGIKGDIDRTLDELVPAEKTSVDPTVAKKPDNQVLAHLLQIHRYYIAHCIPRFLAKAQAKADENERKVIPEAVQGTVEAILTQTASLPAARAVIEALVRDLDEHFANVKSKLDSVKRADYLGVFSARMAELKKNPLRLMKRKLRFEAAKSCDDWKRSEKEIIALKLECLALKATTRRLRLWVSELVRRERELRERLTTMRVLRERFRRAATAQSEAIASVVAPDELDGFIDKVGRGIDDKLGDLPSPLAPSQLMGSGLAAILDRFAQETRGRYAMFVRNELKSLSGAIAYGRLRFTLGPWAAEAAARLGSPVALNFLTIGGESNAAHHQYIAAPTVEHAVLKQAKAANPALRRYQVMENAGDPFTVVVRDRYAVLPVSTLAAAPDYEVAIAEVEQYKQSKVVNVLWHHPEVEEAKTVPLASVYEPQTNVSYSPLDRRGQFASNDGQLLEPINAEA